MCAVLVCDFTIEDIFATKPIFIDEVVLCIAYPRRRENLSLVFGAVHLTSLGDSAPVWVAALDTGLLSVALCVAREYSKSLWPAIYMHGANNALAFVFLYLVH